MYKGRLPVYETSYLKFSLSPEILRDGLQELTIKATDQKVITVLQVFKYFDSIIPQMKLKALA